MIKESDLALLFKRAFRRAARKASKRAAEGTITGTAKCGAAFTGMTPDAVLAVRTARLFQDLADDMDEISTGKTKEPAE